MNSWIDQIFEFRNCHENDKMRVEGSVLEDEVLKKWKETQLELKETIAKDEEKYWNASLVCQFFLVLVLVLVLFWFLVGIRFGVKESGFMD